MEYSTMQQSDTKNITFGNKPFSISVNEKKKFQVNNISTVQSKL